MPKSKDIYPQSTEFALALGIPADAIIEEYNATSTYTNVVESLELMGEYGFDSALVVMSDYHLKRSKMIYDRVNDGQYELKYIAALGADGETWKEKSYSDSQRYCRCDYCSACNIRRGKIDCQCGNSDCSGNGRLVHNSSNHYSCDELRYDYSNAADDCTECVRY